MKHKKLIFFIALTIHTSTLPANFWRYCNPIPFFVGAFHYFSFISNYFIPATQADLQQAKKDQEEKITRYVQDMKTIALEKIDHIFSKAQSELKEKIDEDTEKTTNHITLLGECFKKAKEESSGAIRKNHTQLAQELKTKIEANTHINKEHIEQSLGKISSFFTISRENIKQQFLELFSELQELREKHTRMRKNIKKLIKESNTKLSNNLQKDRDSITKKIGSNTQKLEEATVDSQKKIAQLRKQLDQFKQQNLQHNQKVERTVNCFIKLNKAHDELIKQLLPTWQHPRTEPAQPRSLLGIFQNL